MNELKKFVNNGGSVTRQSGNYIFGLDNSNIIGSTSEILVFSASTGELLESKMVTIKQQARIRSVNDIHDFIFNKRSKRV